MPQHYAPCLVGSAQDPNVVYAEELLYPDFSIPEPGFLTEEHAAAWRASVQKGGDYLLERFVLWAGRAYFVGQRGQNLVLRNVSFSNNPPFDTWAHNACTKPGATHRHLKPLAAGEAPGWSGRAVLANSPDGMSFQHFLDRLSNMLFQTEGWRTEGTRIVTSPVLLPHVNDIWMQVLQRGPPGQQVVANAREFSVEELIFPCRCPLKHPFFRERLRRIMQLPEAAPVEDRKTVLYFSRSSGGTGGQREVTNEAAVLKAIKDLLKERNRGEQLLLYDPSNFPHIADLAAFLAANVSAIVGPHGGQLYNIWFAAPDTLLLEFWPTGRPEHMFWSEAALLQLRYWVIPCPSRPPFHDMRVQPKQVEQVLREQLGQRRKPEDEAQPYYMWEELFEGQASTDGL